LAVLVPILGGITEIGTTSSTQKQAGPTGLPLLACRCTNRPFFQDTQVKRLMNSTFQKIL